MCAQKHTSTREASPSRICNVSEAAREHLEDTWILLGLLSPRSQSTGWKSHSTAIKIKGSAAYLKSKTNDFKL